MWPFEDLGKAIGIAGLEFESVDEMKKIVPQLNKFIKPVLKKRKTERVTRIDEPELL